MIEAHSDNEGIRNYIIEAIRKEKPATVSQLIKIIQEKYNTSKDETINLLLVLEAQNQISFPVKPIITSDIIKPKFIVKSLWFCLTMILVLTTAIVVLIVPAIEFPANLVRYALGLIFISFFPGYTLLKALFPRDLRANGFAQSIQGDSALMMALSIGLSIAVTPLVGILLNFTSWGLQIFPLTISLLALTSIFATVGLLRETRN